MKKISHSALMFITLIVLMFVFVFPAHAVTNWRGHWYLRGDAECKEIDMDRKGRTTIGIYPKAIVEKKEDNYYLTVESMGKKYSYMLLEQIGPYFELELISVGPNRSLPPADKIDDAYSGLFRKMVDCQTVLFGQVDENPIN